MEYAPNPPVNKEDEKQEKNSLNRITQNRNSGTGNLNRHHL